MSGIFGIIGGYAAARPDLRRMSEAMHHRGPDDLGVFAVDGAAMGCRLLRTLGPNEASQPVRNEQDSIWVSLDGAVYNREPLLRELEKVGKEIPSDSDARLLMGLYTLYGTECLKRLRGHFACAIWDRSRRKLILARDQLGQKPLFYSESAHGFLFASEIKALLAVLPNEPGLDPKALDQYLSMRFVPGEGTMIEGIKKLRPAHWLSLKDGIISTSRYWKLTFSNKLQASEEEYLEGLEVKLEETVKCHVPTGESHGAFLSGGLDSSLIVAMMARTSRHPIPTFSIGFDEPEFDELPFARQVSETFQTNQFEARADTDVLNRVPAIIQGLDEPSDPVAASFFVASQLASMHVKVALGGDGGNELFAGPERYRGVLLADYLRWVPKPLRDVCMKPMIRLLPTGFGYSSLKTRLAWLERMAREENKGDRLAEAVAFFRFNQGEKDQLLTSRVRFNLEPGAALAAIADRYWESDAEDPIDRMSYVDYCTRLPEHLLMLVDRMSMAHSLEIRSPLVDRELVEYLASFPSRMKVRGHRSRYVWYRLAERLLPREIARRKKRGFRLPLAIWFAGKLQPVLKRVFEDSLLVADGIFEPAYLGRVLDEHVRRRADNHWKIWMLLNLEIWYRMKIRGVGQETVESWLSGKV